MIKIYEKRKKKRVRSYHLSKVESEQHFVGEAILFYLFFPRFLNFSNSQILAHDSEKCYRRCTPRAGVDDS